MRRRIYWSMRGLSLDHVDLSLELRVDVGPGEVFRVNITVAPIGLRVEVADADVREAIHGAAVRCASDLRDRGYAVTPAEVLDSLEAIAPDDPRDATGPRIPPN